MDERVRQECRQHAKALCGSCFRRRDDLERWALRRRSVVAAANDARARSGGGLCAASAGAAYAEIAGEGHMCRSRHGRVNEVVERSGCTT